MPIKLIIGIVVGLAILSTIFLVFFSRIYSGAESFEEAEQEDVGALDINRCKLLCETYDASGLACKPAGSFCIDNCSFEVKCEACNTTGPNYICPAVNRP